MKKHILLTNDFFPKIGGIQSYLYEIYSRLDPKSFIVITSKYPGAEAFDKTQPYKIIRYPSKVLLPTRKLTDFVVKESKTFDSSLILIDPIFPLGLISKDLAKAGLDYGYIVHGAELTIYARLFATKRLLKTISKNSKYVIAAGIYPFNEFKTLTENKSTAKVINIPPGVDIERFRPATKDQRLAAREKFGLDKDAFVIISVSRLVKRKGMDALIKAADELKLQIPELEVIICGEGRDKKRLERINKRYGWPVKMIGKVSYNELPDIYQSGDVFVMACKNRWFDLEQEGFGIVFLEAAASGLPQIGGQSGGSSEAIDDENTGYLIRPNHQSVDIASKVNFLFNQPDIITKMSSQARYRTENTFNYDKLSNQFSLFLSE